MQHNPPYILNVINNPMMKAPFHVVFIDDNEVNNKLATIIIDMDQLPIAPHVFTGGHEALEYLHKCADDVSGDPFPDFIFIDLNMPRLHGFDLVKEYEQHFSARYPDTKLYILCTIKRLADEEKARQFSSVFGFFEKPFSKEIAAEVLGE